MMNLHLIRHGETDWNKERRVQGQSESNLNETGRAQASALQDTILALNPSAVHVSSAVRTRQTAELLTANIDVPHQFRDDLREIHLGPWETRLWDEVEAEAPLDVDNFRNQPHLFSLEGAESFQQLQDRGVSAIEAIIASEIANEHAGQILVVSHGAILKALLLHYAGVDLSRQWSGAELYNCAQSVLRADKTGKREVVSIAGVAQKDIHW